MELEAFGRWRGNSCLIQLTHLPPAWELASLFIFLQGSSTAIKHGEANGQIVIRPFLDGGTER